MTQLLDLNLTVNGASRQLQVEPRRLLIHALREDLGLTGAHVGCEDAQCGACVVLLDGRPVKACNLLAAQADGAAVVTIEGLAPDGRLHPVQEAFCAQHAVQCGYCTPGMIMTAVGLLEAQARPDDETIRLALCGNLCRCTGYQTIVAAVRAAGEQAELQGAAR